MKKIVSIAAVIVIAFVCLGSAYADDEGEIDQLITAYIAAQNDKNIESLKECYYKNYYEIVATKAGKLVSHTSEGGEVYKVYEKYFRLIKSTSNTNRQISVHQNIAYVQCDESQTLKNGKTDTFKSVLTCVKERGRWYIAVVTAYQIQ